MVRLADPRTMRLVVHNDKWLNMRLYLQEEGYEAKQTTSKKSRFVKATLGITHTMIVNHDAEPVVGTAICAPLTTADLNFITWKKAYPLFPFTTFIQCRSFALTSFSERLNDVFARQHNDGLRTLSVDWFQSGSNRMMRSRRIGDKYTWVIDLDTTGINETPSPDKFIESTTFCLRQGFTADSNAGGTVPLAHYKMGQLGILDHPVLRRGYIVLYDEDTRPRRECQKKISDLTKRLNETTIIELGKISQSQRPSQYYLIRAGQITAIASRELFALPTTWVFCDNDLIECLDRACVELQDAEEKERRTA